MDFKQISNESDETIKGNGFGIKNLSSAEIPVTGVKDELNYELKTLELEDRQVPFINKAFNYQGMYDLVINNTSVAKLAEIDDTGESFTDISVAPDLTLEEIAGIIGNLKGYSVLIKAGKTDSQSMNVPDSTYPGNMKIHCDALFSPPLIGDMVFDGSGMAIDLESLCIEGRLVISNITRGRIKHLRVITDDALNPAVHLTNCNHLFVDHLEIISPGEGLRLEGCQRVRVEGFTQIENSGEVIKFIDSNHNTIRFARLDKTGSIDLVDSSFNTLDSIRFKDPNGTMISASGTSAENCSTNIKCVRGTPSYSTGSAFRYSHCDGIEEGLEVEYVENNVTEFVKKVRKLQFMTRVSHNIGEAIKNLNYLDYGRVYNHKELPRKPYVFNYDFRNATTSNLPDLSLYANHGTAVNNGSGSPVLAEGYLHQGVSFEGGSAFRVSDVDILTMSMDFTILALIYVDDVPNYPDYGYQEVHNLLSKMNQAPTSINTGGSSVGKRTGNPFVDVAAPINGSFFTDMFLTNNSLGTAFSGSLSLSFQTNLFSINLDTASGGNTVIPITTGGTVSKGSLVGYGVCFSKTNGYTYQAFNSSSSLQAFATNTSNSKRINIGRVEGIKKTTADMHIGNYFYNSNASVQDTPFKLSMQKLAGFPGIMTEQEMAKLFIAMGCFSGAESDNLAQGLNNHLNIAFSSPIESEIRFADNTGGSQSISGWKVPFAGALIVKRSNKRVLTESEYSWSPETRVLTVTASLDPGERIEIIGGIDNGV